MNPLEYDIMKEKRNWNQEIFRCWTTTI